MEKELKIAELAQVWGVSVPTTWTRIKKMNLTTFIKRSETNKEINYVRISDEQINEFIINPVNNDYNAANNGYYKETLSNNKIDNSENAEIPPKKQTADADFIKEIINLNNNYNEQLKTAYETFNNRIERLNEELITFKSKVPLLEDKANREGFYIKENNDLKQELKSVEKKNKVLLIFIITLIMIIITALTYALTVYNVNKKLINNVDNYDKMIERIQNE